MNLPGMTLQPLYMQGLVSSAGDSDDELSSNSETNVNITNGADN